MKILIAVTSCLRDREFNNGVRTSWVRWVFGADVTFFLGRQDYSKPLEDEVFLDCPDDYQSLPLKTKALCAWALLQGYDYLFKCDPDTLVIPRRLMSSDFAKYDYVGGEHHGGYASGGSGYWLSKKSMQFVSNAEMKIDTDMRHGEDFQVGMLLEKNGILLTEDRRYRLNVPGAGYRHGKPAGNNDTHKDVITFHPWGVLRLDTTEKMHAAFQEYNRED